MKKNKNKYFWSKKDSAKIFIFDEIDKYRAAKTLYMNGYMKKYRSVKK